MFEGEHSNSIKKNQKILMLIFIIFFKKVFFDWERRIEYEQIQRELYESAQKKLKISPIAIFSSEQLFSPEEKYAIAYFQRTGFYPYYQKLAQVCGHKPF